MRRDRAHASRLEREAHTPARAAPARSRVRSGGGAGSARPSPHRCAASQDPRDVLAGQCEAARAGAPIPRVARGGAAAAERPAHGEPAQTVPARARREERRGKALDAARKDAGAAAGGDRGAAERRAGAGAFEGGADGGWASAPCRGGGRGCLELSPPACARSRGWGGAGRRCS